MIIKIKERTSSVNCATFETSYHYEDSYVNLSKVTNVREFGDVCRLCFDSSYYVEVDKSEWKRVWSQFSDIHGDVINT